MTASEGAERLLFLISEPRWGAVDMLRIITIPSLLWLCIGCSVGAGYYDPFPSSSVARQIESADDDVEDDIEDDRHNALWSSQSMIL